MRVSIQNTLFITFLLLATKCMYGGMIDNRWLPSIPVNYTATQTSSSYYNAHFIALTGSKAKDTGSLGYTQTSEGKSQYQVRRSTDKEVGIPELNGQLNVHDICETMASTLGVTNPILAVNPAWEFYGDFIVEQDSHIQGQGFELEAYTPITKYCGVGAHATVANISILSTLTPTSEVVKRFGLAQAGNNQYYLDIQQKMLQDLNLEVGSLQVTGMSDIDVYLQLFNNWEYTYKFQHIDASCRLGALVPTGMERDISRTASIPLGGQGHWGWYIAPRLELEVKDDWKVGLQLRLQNRFKKVRKARLVVGKEPLNFGVLQGDVQVDPGLTFMVAPFVAMDDFSRGFGVRGQFTLIKHDYDLVRDVRKRALPYINTRKWIEQTEWLAEYVTVHVYYDTKYRHPEWRVQPKFNFRWDMPVGVAGGYGYAKVNRVSLGVTITF